MRSRKERFKREHKKTIKTFKSITFQLIAITYTLFCTAVILTSPTIAYFNDIERIDNSLRTKWDADQQEDWDKSSLAFTASGVNKSCTNIFVKIKNGEDSRKMEGAVEYHVFHKVIESKGKYQWEKVASGMIEPLEPGEIQTLTYTPDKNGKYRFKAYQRPGHPGKSSERGLKEHIEFNYLNDSSKQVTERENEESKQRKNSEEKESDNDRDTTTESDPKGDNAKQHEEEKSPTNSAKKQKQEDVKEAVREEESNDTNNKEEDRFDREDKSTGK